MCQGREQLLEAKDNNEKIAVEGLVESATDWVSSRKMSNTTSRLYGNQAGATSTEAS